MGPLAYRTTGEAHTPTGSFQTQRNVIIMFLDSGREWRYPETTLIVRPRTKDPVFKAESQLDVT